ncbi:hypothetical protein SOVF_061800 [Spinacia oleracea]|nr:hypothetical protein SOVF_061800 [Spinacia oleracea]
MAKQTPTLFLEDWLRSSTSSSNVSNNSSKNSANSSAQMIIQAWVDLRECHQKGAFHPRHLHSLKALVNSQASLYVADPQAKLLLSILSSPNISLPHDSPPLIFRLLYVWVRKSSKPSLALIDLAMEVIAHIFSDQFDAKKSKSLFAEGVLLVGAFCSVPSIAENTKTVCLKLVCRMLEEQYQLIGSVGKFIPDVLAGIGYALSSSGEVYFVRLLNFLLGNWVKIEVPHDISHALVILHLIEWVVFRLITSSSLEKIKIFSCEVMENPKTNYAKYAVLMATAGALRASNRPVKHGERLNIVTRFRIAAEAQIEVIASDLISKIATSSNIIIEDAEVSFILRCLLLAASRSGGLISSRGPLLLSLALGLLIEVLPLRRFYGMIVESQTSDNGVLIPVDVKNHLESILFREAGAATGVFCNLYASASEKDKSRVEDLIWSYCHDIYSGHRLVALLLQGRSDQLLNDMEKIAESVFLMVAVFAFAVTKHKLTSKFSREMQMDCAVKILISFSCMEYFRHIQLPEYMEAIRSAATSVQENEIACVSFVESLPSYADLTNPQGLCHLQRGNYIWSKDEVQTSRIWFYLRVIPTCISHLPTNEFQKVVAATMFLYMGHPDNKVARASHLVFSSFVTFEEESSQKERMLLKEQLVFYYMRRSLEAYPGITPFDGLGSGVSALVRHLPAGSPSIYYCIHSLVEKANVLSREVTNLKGSEWWKNWQGDSEPCQKIIELLMQLISMVDIQVLPEMMKRLAQLVIQLPKDGQNVSLSYVCSQPTATNEACIEVSRSPNSLSLQNVTARL